MPLCRVPRPLNSVRRTQKTESVDEVIREALRFPDSPDHRWESAIASLHSMKDRKKAVNRLASLLRSSKPEFRERAARVLKQLSWPESSRLLVRHAKNDRNPIVRSEALTTLLVLSRGDKSAEKALGRISLAATNSKSALVRAAGFECLHHLGGSGVARTLRKAARDTSRSIRAQADWWLAEHTRRFGPQAD